MKSIKANSGVVYEKGYVMIFIYFFYFLSELCGIGNIAYYMLYPGGIIAFESSFLFRKPPSPLLQAAYI